MKIHALNNDYSHLRVSQQKVVYQGQLICAPTKSDRKLLKNSYVLGGLIKREVMMIRFHLAGGHILESKLFKGSAHKVSSYKDIVNTMLDLEFRCRKLGPAIVKAEIAHTHLSECVVNSEQLKLCLLSESDLTVARRLKQFRSYPIEIKAIAKDGLVFKKVF